MEVYLQRFDQSDVSRLAEQFFKRGASVNARVVEHLLEKSEGNPFFLIETIRALFDRHGDGDQVLTAEDLASATAGGIRKTLRRRLARLSSEDLELLQIAAICGRRVDFEVLEPFIKTEAATAWAARCEQAAVFAGEDGSLRFAHDKLRETVIEYMPEDRTSVAASPDRALS